MSTSEERAARLEELKEALKAAEADKHPSFSHVFGSNDVHLQRFLRSRGYDVEAAKNMVLNHLKLRDEYDLDNIATNLPKTHQKFQLLHDYFPGRLHGTDREGVGVYYERLGMCDAVGWCNLFSLEDVLPYRLFKHENNRIDLERVQQENPDKKIFGRVVIMDLDGLGLKHIHKPALDMFREILRYDTENYPEMMKRLYVVNNPAMFGMVWKIVKPWLDPGTASKIKIIGSDYKQLYDDVPPDQLPPNMGGTCVCNGDAHCIKGGGTLTGFRDNGTTYFPVKVPLSKKVATHITIEPDHLPLEPKIAWEFTVASSDAEFHVAKDGAPIEKKKKYTGTAKGEVAVDAPGTYTLQWENPSYLSSRELQVAVDLVLQEHKRAGGY
mmetsp:Transcript_35597/g.89447  ORF Transcript_35597/g.89447 Transcript_35597/m.89447 type:complete len:382 (-) Transcript_35597:53-1198(-)|eukprot:CAMPEP_0177651478 /NCGR_PEP_ID=MMETSP0447-20121125/12574_1 /TAXON_ID=0 /ORGANISM="Stygamoeba regulata, Strain BSH-02190019" /LENGTH=381 /DNA_ID=CAMNT_0019154571 /DNA_START=111 /DNA_END=1256 /DNA_ORIENTATION=-